MKILVFDDTHTHLRAAQAMLKGHDLTVVKTYDEAEEALVPHTNYDKAKDIFAAKYGDRSPYQDCASKEIRQERMKYYDEALRMATTFPSFDVVLTDLLVPASSKAQGPEGRRFVGTEMPLGTVIALRALAAGAKYVAVVTDMNHHNHPASASFDGFGQFSVGGVKVLCTNRATTLVDAETFEPVSYDFLQTPEGKQKYPQNADYSHRGTISSKAWSEVLELLIKGDESSGL